MSADHPEQDHAPGTMGGYMIGFGLSAILTVIPFWLVMSGALGSAQATGIAIMAFAVVQIVVHMIFFLHMNTRSEGGWTFMALIFTLVLVVITLSGSMWVMYHLNHNMMPAMTHDMSQMP
ncbi:cytochrome o ubiquinol oxidase subunit IV [Sphingobium sp. AN641]|uniref:cytochrome o ubiquinol oxidase subunit IV n=1 Tax=Sphingobium sp. AN641 TaxID=3133443 RepID=UPI0030C1E262